MNSVTGQMMRSYSYKNSKRHLCDSTTSISKMDVAKLPKHQQSVTGTKYHMTGIKTEQDKIPELLQNIELWTMAKINFKVEGNFI